MIDEQQIQLDSLLGKTRLDLETIYNDFVRRLPFRSPIYLPTERVSLIDRILGLKHVLQIYHKDLDQIYRPRLQAIKKRFNGQQRCFLIGNGPSLNQTDLSVLKHEVTFAVNGFFLKAAQLDWRPTFYLVEDHLVAEDRSLWINSFTGSIKLFPAYLGYIFSGAADTIFYNHRPRISYPHRFDFSLEADKVTYTGCTVTFSMMQIAAYFGFKEIYLIGVDASYAIPEDAKQGQEGYNVGVLDMESADPNHFDPNYFGKGFRWHDPQVEKMIEAYTEAKRTLEATHQRIYNATVGGELEVFERRDFQELFPQARKPLAMAEANMKRHLEQFPRVLLLDMTALGQGTATGELKATLFQAWPNDRLLQVARYGEEGLGLVTLDENGSIHQIPSDPAHAREAILEFAPDVVLYRPVPKVQWLHAFAMETIDWLQRPLLTWFMDDWPADLNSSNDPEWQTLRLDLQRLLTKSSVCLSICEAMSKAYKQRYGKDFIAIANGVNPVEWPALRQHEKGKLLVRYAGGLSDNMCLDSVLRLARSVEILGQEGLDIRLEINTQKWWWKRSHTDFAGFTFTKIESKEHSIQEYRSWISEADISVIAYNFDMNSLRYVRYSMANKMPECLASGSVVLAHGPVEIATIQYLSKTDAAVIVTTPSEQALVDTLRELASDPAKRNQLARQGRDLAFQRHNMLSIREQLRSVIFSCCMARSGESRASQRMLVLRYSSEWLLDQEQTRLKLAADPILTANLAEAINGLSSDDALKQQYIAVTDFVARAEKRSKTPLGDRQLQELILGNFSSRNSNELIIENKTQTP